MKLSIFLLPALFLAAASPFVRADPPSTQELLDKINALQARVDQLESERNHPRSPEQTQIEKETIATLQADAARHSKLVDFETFTAGYRADKGIVIQNENGDFVVHPFASFQFRNETSIRDNGKSDGRSDTENGFEVRRLKLGLDGNLFGPELTYQFILSFDRHTGILSLEDAWGKYRFDSSPFYIRAGQIRDPLDHEQITFGSLMMTVERSMIADLFAAGEGIVQGVAIGYDNAGPVRAELAFTDGLRSLDTNFQEFPTITTPGGNPTINSNWGVAGRVEYKVMGDWKQYSGFTALNAMQPLIVFGLGADYTEAGDTRQLTHVVNAQFDSPCGFSLYAAYLGRYVAHNSGLPGTNGGSTGPAGPHTYDATARAEAGYVINKRWEPFVRYEFINFDSSEAFAGHHRIHEFTGGLNYYLYGQRQKFSADISYLPNGSPVGDDASGVLPASSGEETILRLQFQLIL